MSSYFHCLAYDDAQAKIRVEDDAIYMELKDGEIDIHLTFNPIQLLTLNKYLFAAVESVTLADICNSNLFGNLTVDVENKNIDADNFKIPIGCCDNELIFDYAATFTGSSGALATSSVGCDNELIFDYAATA